MNTEWKEIETKQGKYRASILYGLHHQGDCKHFEKGAGLHSFEINIVAIAYHLIEPIYEWGKIEMAEILYYGNSLFNTLYPRNKRAHDYSRPINESEFPIKIWLSSQQERICSSNKVQ